MSFLAITNDRLDIFLNFSTADLWCNLDRAGYN